MLKYITKRTCWCFLFVLVLVQLFPAIGVNMAYKTNDWQYVYICWTWQSSNL